MFLISLCLSASLVASRVRFCTRQLFLFNRVGGLLGVRSNHMFTYLFVLGIIFQILKPQLT